MLELIVSQGLRLGAWAIHQDEVIQRMLELGFAASITDRPIYALRLRDEMRVSLMTSSYPL